MIMNENILNYNPTPLRDVTLKNINDEILMCMAVSFSLISTDADLYNKSVNLYNRASFLKYWKSKGILYDEVKEFEANPVFFLKKMKLPYKNNI